MIRQAGRNLKGSNQPERPAKLGALGDYTYVPGTFAPSTGDPNGPGIGSWPDMGCGSITNGSTQFTQRSFFTNWMQGLNQDAQNFCNAQQQPAPTPAPAPAPAPATPPVVYQPPASISQPPTYTPGQTNWTPPTPTTITTTTGGDQTSTDMQPVTTDDAGTVTPDSFWDCIISHLPPQLQGMARQLATAAGNIPVWGWGAIVAAVLYMIFQRHGRKNKK